MTLIVLSSTHSRDRVELTRARPPDADDDVDTVVIGTLAAADSVARDTSKCKMDMVMDVRAVSLQISTWLRARLGGTTVLFGDRLPTETGVPVAFV